jgi:hypothetical protein
MLVLSEEWRRICRRYVHGMQEYESEFMYGKALAQEIEAYIKTG